MPDPILAQALKSLLYSCISIVIIGKNLDAHSLSHLKAFAKWMVVYLCLRWASERRRIGKNYTDVGRTDRFVGVSYLGR